MYTTQRRKYHEPAAHWELLGIQNYESYCEQLVVKGNFHPSVPDSIKDAYGVAKYMMAHAYYHYALYDEAISKLLRIIKTAIKLKCNEYGITAAPDTRHGNADSEMYGLAIELNKREPNKEITRHLQMLHDVRHVLLQPTESQNSLRALQSIMQAGVVMINELFMPQELLASYNRHAMALGNYLAPFGNCPMLLDYQDDSLLMEGAMLSEAIYTGNQWIYRMLMFPVDCNKAAGATYHPAPFSMWLTDIETENDAIIARDAETYQPVIITITNDPDDLERYHKVTRERNNATIDDLKRAAPLYYFGLNKDLFAFRYKWLWQGEMHEYDLI